MAANTLSRITRGTGPALVLAHGAGGGAEANWGTLIGPLAEHYSVIAPDYPGSGGSPVEEGPLDLDDLADRVVATAVEEGHDSFDLVGFSLGAAVSVRAAARHPGRVRSLVLVAGVAEATSHIRLVVDALLAAERLSPELWGRFNLAFAFGSEWINRHSPAELTLLAKAVAAGTPAGLRQQFELVTTVDVSGDLAGITVPTLVISATADTLSVPAQHRRFAERIPGARLLELASGHLVTVERGPELLAAVQDFLAARHR
ncbi:alpha/beta fold hydrolase [Kitasatospora sp. NPDC001175]|uniref:alpha/beta fold hydrolase n=1 Tax=Kitasatospora sp. NPDC001175 TaxID=3157103 RepID=UPI003CFE4576